MGKIILVILVLGVIGFVAMQNNSTTIANRSKQQQVENMNTVFAARQLNEKWENTCDKTGKYPDGADLAVYRRTYEALTLIPPEENQNYREARSLMPLFAARQPRIDKIEFAKLPPLAFDVQIKLGTLDRSYGVLK